MLRSPGRAGCDRGPGYGSAEAKGGRARDHDHHENTGDPQLIQDVRSLHRHFGLPVPAPAWSILMGARISRLTASS